VACIQPHLLISGALDFPLWLAAHSSGEANPSCLSQLTGFMTTGGAGLRPRPFPLVGRQARRESLLYSFYR
jgi:hypothetical protein